MDFKKLTRIHWKEIQRNTVISYPEVKKFCSFPYPGHEKGCPHVEKCSSIPYFNQIKECWKNFYYLLWIEFNFKTYKEHRKEEHPKWSDAQAGNLYYWQSSVKKMLKDKVKDMAQRNPPFYVLGSGNCFRLPFQNIVFSMESTGINVFSTLKVNKIKFEIKPLNKIILCWLLCSDEELNFKKYKPMNIFDYLPSDKINQEVI